MKSPLFLIVIACYLFSGCKTDNDIKEITLEEISSDIQLFPVKYHEPMKDILLYLDYEECGFLLSNDFQTIYRMEGDTITSVLEKTGRGRGEYQGIHTFTYSSVDSLLYVVDNNSKIYIYKGRDYKFIKHINDLPRILAINSIGKNKLLIAAAILENNVDERYGLYILNTETEELSERMLAMNYTGTVFHNFTNYNPCDSSIYFSIADHDINRIYRYADNMLNTELEFSYPKEMRIPERVIVNNPDNLNELLTFNNYIKEYEFCIGAGYPISLDKGKRLAFWSFPKANDNILNIVSSGKIEKYHVIIPGMKGYIKPECAANNHYFLLYQHISKDERLSNIDKSDLSEKIVQLYENNNGNPVILKFDLK